MSAAAAKTKASANGNGNGKPEPNPQALADAIAYEQEIADRAQEIRGDKTYLDEALFLRLWPLLREPIPAGFIVTTEATRGKPYDSTGIKSLQVQIDRMDNVLTPLNWEWHTEWSAEGRVADVKVTIFAAGEPDNVLVKRRARGGVNQASTDGNLQKGSETNAAKLALARIGVGHEIYLGVTDFDPDVDPDAAKEQGKPDPAPKVERIDADRAAHLRDLFDKSDLDAKKLQTKLGALGVINVRTVNQGLASLTPGQAAELEEWIGGAEA
jgi:hypothetical protein